VKGDWKADWKADWDKAVAIKVSTGANMPSEFLDKTWEIGKLILSDHPWEKQVEYMQKTRKPEEMTVIKYINRIKYTNNCGKYMKEGEDKVNITTYGLDNRLKNAPSCMGRKFLVDQ